MPKIKFIFAKNKIFGVLGAPLSDLKWPSADGVELPDPRNSLSTIADFW